MDCYISAILLITFFMVPLAMKAPKSSPAFLFCTFWTVQFLICYALFQETSWTLETPVWLVFAFIAAYVGQYAGRRAFKKYGVSRNSNRASLSFDVGLAKKLLVVYVCIGLLYSVKNLVTHGFSLLSFSSLSEMAEMNNSIAVDRYGGDGNSSHGIVDSILLTFVYFAPLVAGATMPYLKKKRDKLIACSAFLPALLILLSENTKSVFIAVVIFYTCAYLASSIKLNGKLNVDPAKVLMVGGLAICVVCLLLFSMMLRIGTVDDATLQTVLLKFGNYAFGHVAAFDNWLPANGFPVDLGFGYNSLIGISRFFFSGTRAQGIYHDYYRGEELSTNVYTYFRGLVQDFGAVWTLLVIAVLFAIAGYAYYSIKTGRRSSRVCNTLLLMAYCAIFYYIVSIFSYISYMLIFPLFYAHCLITWKDKQ